jgi:CelD/BcsL family acetyltransferase involved in cellulose biosynthesis
MLVEVREYEGDVPNEIWNLIGARLPPDHRFLSYHWLPAWSKTQLPSERWRGTIRYYVALAPSGEPLGVVPLAHQRFGPILLPALAGYYFPFRGLLFAQEREAEIARAIVAALRSSEPLAFRLGPARRGHASVQAMIEAMRVDGWTVLTKQRGVEFAVDLPDSVDAFRSEYMSTKLRRSIERNHRRMQEQGIRLERYTDLTAERWQAVVADMATVERSSWVGRNNGFLHFGRPANASFWRECLAMPQMSAATHALVLYFDERPTAFEFWFDSGSCRYFIAGLHDDRAAQHSPGSLLMQLMLEDAIESGIARVSCGQGDAGYKSRFGAKPAGFIDEWVAMPPGVLGHGAKAVWNTAQMFAEWRHKRRASET